MSIVNELELVENIKRWIYEDMPFGDVTSDNIFTDHQASGQLIAKEDGVLCGLEVFRKVYEVLGDDVLIKSNLSDGDFVRVGDVIGVISGPMAKVLKGERLGLNLMQRLSGIATMSNKYSALVKDYKTKIVDTRKTTPGLRSLEKYAVKIGGASNHRFSLSDAVMIKDNHIAGAGSIKQAVELVRDAIPHTMKVEVEVESLEEVRFAIEAQADIIMLDNMSNDMTTEAVCMIRDASKYTIIEASGNMTLDRLVEVAKTGVDIISVGALTHSVSALDISLKFIK